jgi:hypothetical protein
MKGVLPCLVRWACRTSTRDLSPAFAACCSSQHSTKFFFLFVHYFTLFVRITQASLTDHHAAPAHRWYLNLCLWMGLKGAGVSAVLEFLNNLRGLDS